MARKSPEDRARELAERSYAAQQPTDLPTVRPVGSSDPQTDRLPAQPQQVTVRPAISEQPPATEMSHAKFIGNLVFAGLAVLSLLWLTTPWSITWHLLLIPVHVVISLWLKTALQRYVAKRDTAQRQRAAGSRSPAGPWHGYSDQAATDRNRPEPLDNQLGTRPPPPSSNRPPDRPQPARSPTVSRAVASGDPELDHKDQHPVGAISLILTIITGFIVLIFISVVLPVPVWAVLLADALFCWLVIYPYFREVFDRRNRQRPTPRQASVPYPGGGKLPEGGDVLRNLWRFIYSFKSLPDSNVSYRDFDRIRHLLRFVVVDGAVFSEDDVDYITHDQRFYMYRWTVPFGLLSGLSGLYLVRLTFEPDYRGSEAVSWANWFWQPLGLLHNGRLWLIVFLASGITTLVFWNIWRAGFVFKTNFNLNDVDVPPAYLGFLIDNPDDPLPLAHITDTAKSKTTMFQRLIKSGTVKVYVDGSVVKPYPRVPRPFNLSDKLRDISMLNQLTRGGGGPSGPNANQTTVN